MPQRWDPEKCVQRVPGGRDLTSGKKKKLKNVHEEEFVFFPKKATQKPFVMLTGKLYTETVNCVKAC